MAEHSTPRRVCLEGHASTVLPEGVGTLVTCTSGCVWLTRYGDPRDLIMHAGDSFRIDGPGTVVMTAHHGAVLQIFPGEAPRPVPRSLGARLAGLIAPRWHSAARRLAGGSMHEC